MANISVDREFPNKQNILSIEETFILICIRLHLGSNLKRKNSLTKTNIQIKKKL